MRILIVSDTHRRNDNFSKVIERIGQPDRVIHLGDAEGAEYYLSQVAGCPLEVIAGNNDFFSNLPNEKIIEIEGYKILLTHGHQHLVAVGTKWILEEGRERGVQIVMFGHTHRPLIDTSDERITLINPGSLSYPRQEGKRPSYIIMDIDCNGKIEYTLEYL